MGPMGLLGSVLMFEHARLPGSGGCPAQEGVGLARALQQLFLEMCAHININD